MAAMNGRANGSATTHTNMPSEPASARVMNGVPTGTPFTAQWINELVAELEVPFDPSVIEWRVTKTTKESDPLRGVAIPYADQRAYTDRLNALFTPAGWTRKYAIHTSANFQRSKDQVVVAKVFVSCDLTIFGIGSHSATGEEWADDDNAGTSAEAQAFKRACSCFGLGRYLYYFIGIWVDLDDRKRLTRKPVLVDWATPTGWRNGLRPCQEVDQQASKSCDVGTAASGSNHTKENASLQQRDAGDLVRKIEAMAEPLGKALYRGLLKTIARAWKPMQIQDTAQLRKVLTHMQSADRGLRRLEAALDQTGAESLSAVLRELDVKSLDQVSNLETLHKIVIALEAKAG
jgi:Uncharacterized protein conserved in bacteria